MLRVPDIKIDFACNDPDNGLFVGRVSGIQIARPALDLTFRNWSIISFNGCPRLRVERGRIVMSGKPWPVTRSREWVGNWCWNGYAMRLPDAGRFFAWLHQRGAFQCDGGDVELCDLFEAEIFDEQAFVACLQAAQAQAEVIGGR